MRTILWSLVYVICFVSQGICSRRIDSLPWDEVKQLAFPDDQNVRSHCADTVIIYTNADQLDLMELSSYLGGLAQMLEETIPCFQSYPAVPVRLVVFSEKAEYDHFFANYLDALGVDQMSSSADGITVNGIGFSYWDERWGSVRPVFAHEYIHAYLEGKIGLPNRVSFSWIHEGIANYFQFCQLSPKVNLEKKVETMLDASFVDYSFAELLDGRAVRRGHYLKVLTLVAFLQESEAYQEMLCRLLPKLKHAGDGTVSQKDISEWFSSWEELEQEWAVFCRSRFLSE